MGATGKWAPICAADGDYIDDGTLCRTCSSVPGPYCVEGTPDPVPEALTKALEEFESTALNFSLRFIGDHAARLKYVDEIKAMSNEVLEEFYAGNLSADRGAAVASYLRNNILKKTRTATSEVGKAWAEDIKLEGKSLLELQEKYAQKLFRRDFGKLSETEADQVFMQIVERSGVANVDVLATTAKLSKFSKGFLVLTAALVVYDVATSDRPGREAVKQGTVLGASALGSIVVGAAGASLVCGPGAPVCVGIFVFVGGALAAYGADVEFDRKWK